MADPRALGASRPPAKQCPACAFTTPSRRAGQGAREWRHETGCPYEGLSYREAQNREDLKH
jgi:hypothetical protein